ncbi:MAG: ABC transporter ATP-binding protein [Paenibacillaceae bacterium]
MSTEEKTQKSTRFVYQDDEVLLKPFDWSVLRRMGIYLIPFKNRMIPAILLMLYGAATKLAVPILIGTAIDRVIDPDTGNGNLSFLTIFAGTILGLYVIQLFTNRIRIRITNVIGQQVISNIRNDLFTHIQKLSFRFFDKRPAGSVLVRITNDVNALQDLFTNGVVNILIDVVLLVGIVVVLLTLNFKLGLAIMLTVPLMFMISTSLRKRIRRAWQEVRLRQSRINSHLNESIQGIKVTQAYTQEKENIIFFDEMNTSNRRSWDIASGLNQIFTPILEITGGIGYFILFWYGASLVQNGEITIGLFVTFATFISQFWEPINRLGQMYSQLLIAMASSERIFEFMDERPSVAEKEQPLQLPTIRGDIKFNHIVFEYEQGRPALKDVNLAVSAGQSIALVGHTGSGKSTIINLLCRFYDPVEGSCEIDGHDLRDVSIQSLRSQVGIVLQDTFIFSGSIRDNIRFGKLNATNEEVERAARAVHAHDFISRMAYGYDTQVEERGNVLSMGQRQLISFARALLADPRILILDEATASIDTETEVKIQSALKVLLEGRTSFIIAHRLSTIRHADQIVVMNHGKIMEQGTHQGLLEQKGIYHGLIEAQYRFLQDVV